MSLLVTLSISTSLGSTYAFPDMDRGMVTMLIKQLRDNLHVAPSLVLVNESGACLVIPFRIIQSVLAAPTDEENKDLYWVRPS